MDKYLLAIHFQYMNGDGKLAKELFNSGKSFIASIVPNLLDKSMKTEEGEEICGRIHPENNYYPDWAKEIFRENKENPNILWAQEGYRHCCGRCYNKRQENYGKGFDPYHEHVCLDGDAQSLEKQIEVIGKGKQLIKDELGINPTVYCSPNHLYNDDTLKAIGKNVLDHFDYFLIRNGFDYFFPGLINLSAYDESLLLTILPETKKGKSPVTMTYYDHISEGEIPNWRELLESSSSIENLNILSINSKPFFKIYMNEKAIKVYKKLRDLVR